ncbi:Ig-like domain-containing protein [Pseudoroseomonas cervicalis]|uniref:Ig-like domain-containing protein n=1 Tax=Teichococcus cervicalis TaxID=204525 RepID=UPI0038D053FD
MPFSVTFAKAVTVDGTPSLLLDIGGQLVQASYVWGSGSNTLFFSYVVQGGENDADGVSLLAGLSLNGGSLRDLAGNDASLSLPVPPVLAGVLVDTTAPVIINGTVPPPGTYVAGQALDFTLSFSEAVLVDSSGGTPVLELTIGNLPRGAAYLGGSGSTELTFRYVVQPADLDADGIGIGGLSLQGGTLRDAAGNQADIVLPPLPGTGAVRVDAVPPIATTLEGPAIGTYRTGQTLTFTLAFSEPVSVTGHPALLIDLGGVPRSAALTGSSNPANLVFTYAIQPGDADSDGITVLGVDLGNGAIRDLAGNAYAGGPAGIVSDTSLVRVDGVAPVVTAVSVPNAGAYRAGTALDFTITFSEAISLDTGGGMPSLALTLGNSQVLASYQGGSGAQGLVFRYIVQPGDTDGDGITLGGLSLNGATLRDLAGNDASLSLANLGDTSGVLVDTTPPALTAPGWSAGLYGTGQAVAITLGFDAPVFVQGGTPLLLVTLDGGGTALAEYVSGSGTGALLFHYIPAPGDTAADGIGVSFGPTGLNGATLRDAAGNDLASGGNFTLAGIVIDTTPPAATGITSPNAAGWYRAGDTLVFDVAFGEAVALSGPGQAVLPVEIGGVPVQALLSGQPDAQTLRFSLTLPGGLQDADGIRLAGGPQLNGLSLRDAAGNDALLALAATDFAGLRVDSIAPAVTDIIPPPAGTYVAGATLDFTLVFAETVTVAGAPALTLQIGGATRSLDYVSGSGSSQLVFRYTVQPGDFDQGAGVALLPALSGAAGVVDVAGNAAIGGLPFIDGSPIRVDALPPAVLAVQPVGTPAANAATVDFSITFSEPVAGLTASDLLLLAPGLPDAVIAGISGGGASYLVQVLAGTGTGSLSLGIRAGVADLAGNTLPADHPPTATVLLDTRPPVLTAVTLPANGTYGIGSSLSFTLTYSEAVQLSGTPVLQLDLGGTLVEAALAGGNGTDTLVFTWTVQEGSTAGSIPLLVDLSGTVVTDLAGNTQGLPVATPPDTSGILVDAVRPALPGLALATDSGSAGDGLTNTPRPGLSGTSSGATALQLWRDGVLLDILIPDGSGRWQFTEGSDLADGSYSYTLQAVDAAGNTSAIASLAVTVDTTLPPAPVLATLPGEAMPGGGRLSASGAVTLAGTAEANSLVTVLDGATLLGTAQADAAGGWSLAVALADGPHSLTARATDAAGNAGPPMAALALVVDTTPPALSLAAPLALAENEPAGTLAGQAVAVDAQGVTFSLEGPPETLARFAIEAETGRIRSLQPLDHEATASYALTILATDAAGNVTRLSTSVAVRDVNEAPTARPGLELQADNTGALRLDPRDAAGARDPDGDGLAVSVTVAPAHGTLVVQADGTLLYQAEFNYSGADSFTYRLSDAGGLFTEIRVTVAVPFTGSTPTPSASALPETATARPLPGGNGADRRGPAPPDPMGQGGTPSLTESIQTARGPAGPGTSSNPFFQTLLNAGTGQLRANLAQQGGLGTLPAERSAEETLGGAPAPRPLGPPGGSEAPQGTAPAGEAAPAAAGGQAGLTPALPEAAAPEATAWTGWQEEISLAAGRFERERDALLAALRSLAGLPPAPPPA